ncbi:MAG: AMP-binding protein [bacterium]|nr:AMP-binding protein [bacterium]
MRSRTGGYGGVIRVSGGGTLTAAFERAVLDRPAETAMLVRDGDAVRTVTFAGLRAGALAVARWLLENGLRRGERAAVVMENGPDWCVCYFGILFAGATAVPIDSGAGAGEIARLVERSGARILFATGPPAPDLRPARRVAAGRAAGAGETALDEILARPDGGARLPEPAPEDIASIIFTSGTTGSPKGAMLTHANFLSNVESLSGLGYIRPGDNFLSILPLHHAFPFTVTLLLPLLSGVRITYLSPLRPDLIARCMREQEVTVTAVTPQVLKLLHRGIRDRLAAPPLPARAAAAVAAACCRAAVRLGLPHPGGVIFRRLKESLSGARFRYFVCGGARLDPVVARDFLSWGLTVLEGYGLTETAPVAAMNRPSRPRPGSAGEAIPGVEIRIDRPDRRGAGEILIRGPNVMGGYLDDPAATAAVIENGWLRTGDLGRIGAGGALFIEGRRKEVIVLSSGKKVSAAEVEAHYSAAPSVREICVFPDEAEEKVVAAVVPDLDYFRRSGESNVAERVRWDLELLSARLPPHSRLKDFAIVDDLPRTRLGKVRRHEARAAFRSRARREDRGGAVPIECRSAVGGEVLRVLREETGREARSAEDQLELDLGLDSLGRVSLMGALERACGVRIEESAFLPLLTVGELIAYVEGRAEAGGGTPAARDWGEIIRAGPPPRLERTISIEQGAAGKALAALAGAAVTVVCALSFRLRARGRGHVPEGAFIVCPNHASFIDGFLVFSALPRRVRQRVYFLGLHTYFEVPVLRRLLRWLRIIPVDPARNIVETLQASAFVLGSGMALCVFPEGARSITGEVREFKKGVAIVAREAGVPAVPTFIAGSHRAWGPGARFPRPRRVTVSFGRPLSFEEMIAKGRRAGIAGDDYEAAGAGLRAAVIELGGVSAQGRHPKT